MAEDGKQLAKRPQSEVSRFDLEDNGDAIMRRQNGSNLNYPMHAVSGAA
jgi:hypothetical protein